MKKKLKKRKPLSSTYLIEWDKSYKQLRRAKKILKQCSYIPSLLNIKLDGYDEYLDSIDIIEDKAKERVRDKIIGLKIKSLKNSFRLNNGEQIMFDSLIKLLPLHVRSLFTMYNKIFPNTTYLYDVFEEEVFIYTDGPNVFLSVYASLKSKDYEVHIDNKYGSECHKYKSVKLNGPKNKKELSYIEYLVKKLDSIDFKIHSIREYFDYRGDDSYIDTFRLCKTVTPNMRIVKNRIKNNPLKRESWT